jgi:hypothetical protein
MHLTNSPLQRYAALACVAAVATNDAFAAGSVVEFYNPDLDNFFICRSGRAGQRRYRRGRALAALRAPLPVEDGACHRTLIASARIRCTCDGKRWARGCGGGAGRQFSSRIFAITTNREQKR